MEKSVIVNLTLDETKELYKSSNEKLRMLALKIFPEAALDPPSFTQIRSFEDAMAVLEMNIDDENYTVNILKERSKASAAMFKLNIVRKALNYGQDLHLTMDAKCSFIHYPCNPFVTKNSTYYKSEINSGKMEVIGKINSKGEEYNVLGGGAINGGYVGLGSFNSYYGVGDAAANVGFLGCANKEIAKHLGKYFGMLITEAKYGDMVDFEIISNN